MENDLQVIENELTQFYKTKIVEKEIMFKDGESRFRFDLIINANKVVAIEFKNLNGLEHIPTSYLLNFLETALYFNKIKKKIDKFYFITNAKVPQKLKELLESSGVTTYSTKDATPSEITDEIKKYIDT